MRDLLLATASSVALLAVALEPVKAADKGGPPPIQEPATVASMAPSCYVQALAGSAVNQIKAPESVLPAAISATGWTIGAGVGCDVRIERVVLGALARVEIPVDTDGSFIKSEQSWMAGGRIGYLLNTGLLAYGIVGYTQPDWRIEFEKINKGGIVLGGGLEIALSKSLSLSAEYTQTRFDGLNVEPGLELKPATHAARIGLSYRFNSLFPE